MISTILFDLDGTIANTNEIIIKTITETLERESGRVWAREELLPHWGVRLRDQLRMLHPAIEMERAVPFYRTRYAEHHERLLQEFPGIRAMLERLLVAGYQLGVVTSKKRESAWLTIDSLDYGRYFELVVAEEDTARHKPAPDPLLYALERLQASADAAVYLGDNPDDILAAHAAGMRAIGVNWSLRPREDFLTACPDAMLDTPEDIFAYLEATAQRSGRNNNTV